MQAIPKYFIPDITGTIDIIRSFMFVCLICAAFPMPSVGDIAVGFVQEDVFMSWKISNTVTSTIRIVINPYDSAVILFATSQVIGSATTNYSNRVRDIGNVSLGIVSFRLLNLTVADAGRYSYRLLTGSDLGGQVLVIAGVPANVSIMEVADPFESKTYTVQCSAKPTSVPPGMGLTMHYQWKNEKGQNITASDRYSFSSDQSNLTINPLKRQDSGTLVCEAWEHVGAVSQSGPFSLKVFYGPDPGSVNLSPNKTSYELAETSLLSVNCSTDCFPDCQYRWTGPGGSSPSNTELLTFISIGRSQTGQYTCISSNSKIPDKTATTTINVVVFYGPDDRNVSLSPSNTSYQLPELSPLAVQCAASCFPQCDYQWSGPLVSHSDNIGWLSISQISRNQTGTFICTVTNPRVPGKSATANFSVIVYYGPDTNGLTLSPSNTSYQLTELSPLIVQCSASCVPQCNYLWMGPGVRQNDNRGLFSVSQISRNQGGTFTCIVTNPRIPGKSATTSLSVIVYYGPDAPLTIDPVTTYFRNIEGTFIPNITCSANCNPLCNYQWIGPFGAISSGVLSLGTLDRLMRGSYFCTATNPRTSASVNGSTVHMVVIYGPDIPRLSPTITVYTILEGESVPDIICSADCFPGCTQVWMKGVTAVQESNGGTLSLRQVYRDKAGDYTCWFNNTETKATGYTSIRLGVQYPPVLTMKATNTSKGGRVVINCTASGVPDNYTFYKLTHMAPDVNRTMVRELDLTRVSNSDVSFTIEGATYQDTGLYVCKASNGITLYSTGQLIMEDMVSVWIADQPIITSNARYLAVEKGKSGQMHIEFYSGVIQPIVAWYRFKNGMMEMLQNSSNIGIYLSTLIIELQYYKNTVRLLGYNASVEVFDIQDEHVTSYKVEIYNSFAEPVYQILELKLRGPPDTPTNFHVVLESITSHSLQLSWRAGYHGGASQTFVIEYRKVGETNWRYKSEHNQLVLYVRLNITITDLKEGTTYEFRIYSENIFNRSHISSTVNETTMTGAREISSSTDTLVCTSQTTLIASAVLFCLAAFLFIASLVLYIRIRKDICRGCKSTTSKTDQTISDIGLCQPGDIDGVSNLQVDADRETSNLYEDLSSDIRSAPKYEELSKGSTRHSVSGNHLYEPGCQPKPLPQRQHSFKQKRNLSTTERYQHVCPPFSGTIMKSTVSTVEKLGM